MPVSARFSSKPVAYLVDGSALEAPNENQYWVSLVTQWAPRTLKVLNENQYWVSLVQLVHPWHAGRPDKLSDERLLAYLVGKWSPMLA